ncbi:hypothetical protein Pcinc_019119 [Petrolisthes cinctipes]|uniref:Uncharacterized protein n=1 Tax=Petrolisthes cinctipes TaxID=88211 RepID=A0AAE1FLJ3_PETCI|nr:hypothetical protein Pcinc_019119 [Petrolisthes cinctipes]
MVVTSIMVQGNRSPALPGSPSIPTISPSSPSVSAKKPPTSPSLNGKSYLLRLPLASTPSKQQPLFNPSPHFYFLDDDRTPSPDDVGGVLGGRRGAWREPGFWLRIISPGGSKHLQRRRQKGGGGSSTLPRHLRYCSPLQHSPSSAPTTPTSVSNSPTGIKTPESCTCCDPSPTSPSSTPVLTLRHPQDRQQRVGDRDECVGGGGEDGSGGIWVGGWYTPPGIPPRLQGALERLTPRSRTLPRSLLRHHKGCTPSSHHHHHHHHAYNSPYDHHDCTLPRNFTRRHHSPDDHNFTRHHTPDHSQVLTPRWSLRKSGGRGGGSPWWWRVMSPSLVVRRMFPEKRQSPSSSSSSSSSNSSSSTTPPDIIVEWPVTLTIPDTASAIHSSYPCQPALTLTHPRLCAILSTHQPTNH